MMPGHVIISSDTRGIEPNATLIASLCAIFNKKVRIRLFSRELEQFSFFSRNLEIEIVHTPVGLQLDGRVPDHVSSAGTFDRIAAIPYCTDWDRAVILDYDQVVIGDPSGLFDLDLGDSLVAGRLWPDRTFGEACREWFGRELPERWKECEGYGYFYMGPILNLAELRKSDAYERFVEFHGEANMEEQIALHVACRNRVTPLPAELNTVPQWDGISPSTKILHFTGPAKPWTHPGIIGAPYWRYHETTWEDLTCGLWNPSHGKCLHLELTAPREAGCRAASQQLCGPTCERVAVAELRKFPSGSVRAIKIPAGFEALAWGDLVAALRECLRVLVAGAALEMEALDLEASARGLLESTAYGLDARSSGAKTAAHQWNLKAGLGSARFLHTRESLARAFEEAGFLPEETTTEPKSTSDETLPAFVLTARRSGFLHDPVATELAAIRSSRDTMSLLEIGGWRLDEKVRIARAWMNGNQDRWVQVFRSHPEPTALEEGIGRFGDMLGDLSERTEVLDGEVIEILAWLLTRDDGWESFDAIIVHSSRRSADFLAEACMVWRLLKPGGIMIVHPVAREPGPVGTALFEQGFEAFVTSVSDMVSSRKGSHERFLTKARSMVGSGKAD
jgi:lipopolysaccharide biosynthesis glycosyltransferase